MSSGEHPQTDIPEHSLQSLYISPAITKTQIPWQSFKSRYISVLFLPVALAQWGRMCCRAKHLARIPSDTLTQPLFLDRWAVSPPHGLASKSVFLALPPREPARSLNLDRETSQRRSDLLETGTITNAFRARARLPKRHATCKNEQRARHQARSRRNQQRRRNVPSELSGKRRRELGFDATSSSTYLPRPK